MTRLLVAIAALPLLLPRGVCLCHWLHGDAGPPATFVVDAVCCPGHDHDDDSAPGPAPHDCDCGDRGELPLGAPQPALEVPPPGLAVAAIPALAPVPAPRSVAGAEERRGPRSVVPIYIFVCALLL